MSKKRTNWVRISKIISIVIIIIFSYLITNLIREQFPAIRIESQMLMVSPENATGYEKNGKFIIISIKSDLHYYCSREYNDSTLSIRETNLDETSIRENDPIYVTSKVETKSGKNLQNLELFAGINKERLKRLNKGLNKLELTYYKNRNITSYILVCLNVKNMNLNDTISITTGFERPSFVDSQVGFWVIFITIFVLLGQFVETIMKLLLKSPSEI
jgi:hypothetical protein